MGAFITTNIHFYYPISRVITCGQGIIHAHFQSSSSGGVQSCSGLGVQSNSRGGGRDQEPPYRKSGTQYSTLMPIQREYWFGGVIYHD